MADARHNDQIILTQLAVMDERMKNFDEKLEKILTQVLKTNGRVTTLEIALAVIKGKATMIATLWGTVSALIVAFISIKIFK